MNGETLLDALVMTAVLALPAGNTDRENAAHRASRSASAIRSAVDVPNRIEDWVACVLDRESGATVDNKKSGQGARNPSSSASGRWQFLAAWQHGLPYMVRDRLVDHGMPRDKAASIRRSLSSKPIYRWPGVFQDIGALEVIERGGAFHWRGHTCGLP